MFPSADQVMQSVIQIVSRAGGLALFLLGLDEDWNVWSFAIAVSIVQVPAQNGMLPPGPWRVMDQSSSGNSIVRGSRKSLHCIPQGKWMLLPSSGLSPPPWDNFCSSPNSSKDICLKLQKQNVSIAVLAGAVAGTSLQCAKLSTHLLSMMLVHVPPGQSGFVCPRGTALQGLRWCWWVVVLVEELCTHPLLLQGKGPADLKKDKVPSKAQGFSHSL